MTEVRFADCANDEQIRFAVVAARYNGKWIFCRHRDRSTWEIPGGHREPGENIEDTARRELWEETGAEEFELHPLCGYQVTGDAVGSGMLYFAEVNRLGRLPSMEIAAIEFFDHLPDALTYPHIQPRLFNRVQEWLCMHSGTDERWDVYDSERRLTGRTIRRCDRLGEGEYHLCVHMWITAPDGRFLITQRAPGKGYAGMWESTGGSALAGEDSLTAALREIKEETGLSPKPSEGRIIMSIRREHDFCDVWLFNCDFTLGDIVFQEGETCGARLVAFEELLGMKENGTLVPFAYLEEMRGLIGV